MLKEITYAKSFVTPKNILELIKGIKKPVIRLPSKHLRILFDQDQATMMALVSGYPGVIFIREEELDHQEMNSQLFVQEGIDEVIKLTYRNILDWETLTVVSKMQPCVDLEEARNGLLIAATNYSIADVETTALSDAILQLEKAATTFYCARKAKDDLEYFKGER